MFKDLSKQKIAVVVLVAVGVILTVLFGVRAVRSFMRLQRMGPPPQQQSADVEGTRGWMTVPFIANTFHMPPEYIYNWLGMQPETKKPLNLKDLNAAGITGPQGNILDSVKAAVRQYQKDHPSPPGPDKTRPAAPPDPMPNQTAPLAPPLSTP